MISGDYPHVPQGRSFERTACELLKKTRERLVEDRRDLAKIMAAPFEREKTHDARMRFVNMQVAIEAVDRAIKDEDRQVEISYGVSSLKISPTIVRACLCKSGRQAHTGCSRS
jgi:hypothetical protein